MAFALVQAHEGAAASSSATATATYGSPVTAGNLLIAAIAREGPASSVGTSYGPPSVVATLADGVNKWKYAGTAGSLVAGTGYGCDVWVCEKAVASTPTVTATCQASMTTMVISAFEYSGASGLQLVDQQGALAISTTSASISTNFATAQANELAISVVTGNMSAATVPLGWTSDVNDTTNKVFISHTLSTGAIGVQTAAWTGLTSATNGAGLIVTLAPAGVSGPALLQTAFADAGFGVVEKELAPGALAFGAPVTRGNTLIFIGTMNNFTVSNEAACPIVAATSSAGDTFTNLATPPPFQFGGDDYAVWACANAKGGSTSINLVGGRNPATRFPAAYTLLIMECSGLANRETGQVGMVLDQMNSDINVASQTVSTLSAVDAGDLAFGTFSSFTLENYPPGPGWVQIMSEVAAAQSFQMLLPTTNAVITAEFGSGAAANSTIRVFALKGGPPALNVGYSP